MIRETNTAMERKILGQWSGLRTTYFEIDQSMYHGELFLVVAVACVVVVVVEVAVVAVA